MNGGTVVNCVSFNSKAGVKDGLLANFKVTESQLC